MTTSQERTPLWQWICVFVATAGRADNLALWVRQFFAWMFRSKKEVKSGSGAGTAGSIVALLALIVFDWNFEYVFAAGFFSFIIGMFVIPSAAHWFYNHVGKDVKADGSTTCYDYNQICWDEVHGMFLAALPTYFFLRYLGEEYRTSPMLWIDLFIAFVLFRIFDVKKPSLIGWIEKKFDGTELGVLLDDSLAGLFAAGCHFWFILITMPIRPGIYAYIFH